MLMVMSLRGCAGRMGCVWGLAVGRECVSVGVWEILIVVARRLVVCCSGFDFVSTCSAVEVMVLVDCCFCRE